MPHPPDPTPPARVLAFDTSTERLAVALQARGKTFAVNAEGGAAASSTLLPHVQALLGRAGVALAELEFIAFGRGPGAFTGLRTACAVAQGLALGLGRPVLPIDSLLIVAEDARSQAGAAQAFDVGVFMDARMGEVYAARYAWRGGQWQVLQPPGLFTLQALGQIWAGAGMVAVAGSALAAFGERLPLPAGPVRWEQERDRAAALLRLALQAAAAGAGVDASAALPLYLRDKVALTTSEREAMRSARAAATP
jgi:tRNA threonylcarbamoyladenosine biosynthesis protein TsaB